MSTRTRARIVAVALAAMTLAGMTAVAHAQATDEPTGKQAARRPPTQSQVGEAWHQPQEAADASAASGDARRPPTESQVGKPWRHQTDVSAPSARPDGQPGWRIASLGLLAAALAWRAGWRCTPPPGPAAAPGSGSRPEHDRGHAARWGCRAHPAAPSPCQRRIGPLACPRLRVLSVRWLGGNVRTHYFTPDGRE